MGWSYPRINGGAAVMGFELWMDEWAGGNPRLVFDGTDQPTVTRSVTPLYCQLADVGDQLYTINCIR